MLLCYIDIILPESQSLQGVKRHSLLHYYQEPGSCTDERTLLTPLLNVW
jgi:hypothetical protein